VTHVLRCLNTSLRSGQGAQGSGAQGSEPSSRPISAQDIAVPTSHISPTPRSAASSGSRARNKANGDGGKYRTDVDALLDVKDMKTRSMDYKLLRLQMKKDKEESHACEHWMRLAYEHEEKVLQYRVQLAQINAVRALPTAQVGTGNVQDQGSVPGTGVGYAQGSTYGTGVGYVQGSMYGGSGSALWDAPQGPGESDPLANEEPGSVWPELLPGSSYT
jgi:hypothetical protein